MTLIVEDGTGLANSESLITVAEADTYHRNRGNTAWASLDIPTKERLLRKANDYLTQEYRLRWKGYRTYLTQACDWPRTGVLVNDTYLSAWLEITEIPSPVKNAVAELALRANTSDLKPDIGQQVKRETIGPITVEYDPNADPNTQYVSISGYLRPYLKPGGASHKLVK